MRVCYPVASDGRDARDDGGEGMPLRNEQGEELLTTTEAARELGLSASSVRTQMQRGILRVERLDARTVLIPRSEIERYRAEHLGHHFGHDPNRPLTKGALYARAYRERKKARQQQPATPDTDDSQ